MASRIAAAFVAVALLAVGVLGVATWLSARGEISDLVSAHNATTEQDVTAELADAYRAAGSWASADLRPARAVAASSRATLLVRDAAGETVTGTAVGSGGGAGPGGPGLGLHSTRATLGPAREVPITVGGSRVGTAVLRFPLGGSAAEQGLRHALGRTVVWAGALAAGLAVAIGLAVAGRIARPLRRLTSAARALQAGDRSARTGAGQEPAELGELARAFDSMAATIERGEELRRAFAADVAHELRTPVTIAQAELEALVDGAERPTPERLQSLHDEMLRLARIVEDVETLAAAEAARFRLERRRVDLAEIARNAVAALRAQAEAAELELATDLEPAPVDGDRARLEQVTRNLVANALKFTPPGGHVHVGVAVANGDAQLVVEDTGPGVAADERAHLFERFWRGRDAAGKGGSGVGLAVVSELVQAHGGTVEVSDGAAGGARFTVRLPRG